MMMVMMMMMCSVCKVKDTAAGEVSDLLLARDYPRLSQHRLRSGRTSRPTSVSHRLFVFVAFP